MHDCAIVNASWIINPGADTPPLQHGSLIIRDGFIAEIGPADEVETDGLTPIDARGLVLVPGLINTHDHCLECLTRALPGAQDAELGEWLRIHNPIWSRATPEALQSATQIRAAELLLSGCTTTMDHNYLWPNGCSVDDQVEAMQSMGLRFHVSRGSVTIGASQGGLTPDAVAENEADVLADSERVIGRYHDPTRGSLLQVVLAPCSPYSVSDGFMCDTAALARQHGVRLHTHLAEGRDEHAWCLQNLEQTPLGHIEALGWLADDAWFAHMITLSAPEIMRLGMSGAGVAHCPCSNMRLGNGIAPIRSMLARGVPVGIGVDGAASNDGGNLLAETRQAMLLQRVDQGAAAMSAERALALATAGGAEVLGRSDIGRLAPGMAADITGFRLDALEMAGGAIHDPLAALALCPPARADLVVVNGTPRVQGGELLGHDLGAMVERHNALARALVEGS
ncbi:8-oxoguanine deaminase [Spiribacter insolitus]|uniref:8-oxoguanine deaminase n=1 Tax=Spiribacter insolitus TaxID=3122417 RepID=A0ABV3T4W2_9GAMM